MAGNLSIQLIEFENRMMFIDYLKRHSRYRDFQVRRRRFARSLVGLAGILAYTSILLHFVGSFITESERILCLDRTDLVDL